MSDSKSKPWDSWPVELPTAAELAKIPEYEFLENKRYLAEMSAEQRKRLFETKFPETKGAAVVVQGGSQEDVMFYDTDAELCPFRQEAFFRYLFCINEPDCYGVLDLERREALLFVPDVPESAERWNGERRPNEYYRERYLVDAVYSTAQLDAVLKERGVALLYVLDGVNSDSGSRFRTVPKFPGMEAYKVDSAFLYPVLSEQRAIKTKREIDYMRVCGLVTSQAHVYVMRHLKPGMTELQCEALFKAYTCYFGAARAMAYTCICGSGGNGAILHYGHAARPNDKVTEDGENIVLDMGAEYNGYATDMTRSYPVNGKFTEDQRMVHNAVHAAQQAVFRELRPGVLFPDLHRLAERVILEHLLAAGVLHNGTVDEMMAAHMGSLFMPHGLGHMLGLLVHDVGGYPEGVQRSTEPGLCWLRNGRKLEAGMVVTIEPGIYFNAKWLESQLRDPAKAKFVNADVLKRFHDFGGCRLEDDVVITESGYENFTVLPTTVHEIEDVMQKVRAK